MFHIFFYFLNNVQVLILLFAFNLSLWSFGTAKATMLQALFIIIIISSGRLAMIRWPDYISKSQRSLCVSFSRTDPELCIYQLFVLSNFNFLHNSQWISMPTQSCLVLNYFCANLLHSLIMWLINLSLSPDTLHLLFWCALSILDLI